MLEVLTTDDVSRLHEATLRILKEIGINVRHRQAREMLAKAGATVDGERVHFSPSQVEAVLAKLPHGFDLYGRSLGHHVSYRRGNTYFRPSGGPPNVLDLQTGARRIATMEDARAFVLLADALDGFDIVNAVVNPADAPAGIPNLHRFLTSHRFSEKPSDITVMTAAEVRAIVRIGAAIRGSAQALREKPLTVVYVSPVSPLTWLEDQAEALLEVAREGLPLAVLPCPMMGITAPITMAGAVAQSNAETLSGIVLASVIEPQLPIVYCNRITTGNMRTLVSSSGGPEIGLTSAMVNQLAGLYGLPTNAYGLGTSAKTQDAQSGYEKAIDGMLMALSGGTVLSGGGSLDDVLTTSFVQLVIDSEINCEIRHCLQTIQVNGRTLALGALSAAVMGSGFIAEQHTVEQLRSGALWRARLGTRAQYDSWKEEGALALAERAQTVASKILSEHQVPPLPSDTEEQIGRIIAEAAKGLDRG